MNHPQSSFARSIPPRAVAIGRTIKLPPLGRPATLHYRQHGSTHERGRGVPELGMLSRASIPADGRRGPVLWILQSGFSLSDDCLPERLGRGALLRSFSGRLSGCVNTRLANINDAADHLLHNRSDRFPSHSKVSVRYGPEPKRTRGQAIGKPIQGRD